MYLIHILFYFSKCIINFLDETTRTKFLFYGGNDYQASGGLSEFITVDDMPDFLGGPCEVSYFEFLFVILLITFFSYLLLNFSYILII